MVRKKRKAKTKKKATKKAKPKPKLVIPDLPEKLVLTICVRDIEPEAYEWYKMKQRKGRYPNMGQLMTAMWRASK